MQLQSPQNLHHQLNLRSSNRPRHCNILFKAGNFPTQVRLIIHGYIYSHSYIRAKGDSNSKSRIDWKKQGFVVLFSSGSDWLSSPYANFWKFMYMLPHAVSYFVQVRCNRYHIWIMVTGTENVVQGIFWRLRCRGIIPCEWCDTSICTHVLVPFPDELRIMDVFSFYGKKTERTRAVRGNVDDFRFAESNLLKACIRYWLKGLVSTIQILCCLWILLKLRVLAPTGRSVEKRSKSQVAWRTMPHLVSGGKTNPGGVWVLRRWAVVDLSAPTIRTACYYNCLMSQATM